MSRWNHSRGFVAGVREKDLFASRWINLAREARIEQATIQFFDFVIRGLLGQFFNDLLEAVDLPCRRKRSFAVQLPICEQSIELFD